MGVELKIASVEVIPYALPFKEPYVTAAGTLTRREMVLLRLRSEDGLVGLGEAVPLSLRGGVGLVQVVRSLQGLGESDVLQRALEREDTDDELGGAPELPAPARCAALTALLDLRERGSALGRHPPGSEAAGMWTRHEPVPVNATLVSGRPVEVAEDAMRWAADGFSTFKLKVGGGDDLEQVQAVREALGPEPRLRLDANGSWSLDHAKRLLAELEPLGIECVEQPVRTTEEAARLARETCVPLAGDESIESRADAEQALQAGAYRLAGIKLSKVGGIAEGRAIAGLLHSYVSSALDGPVGIAAGARLAQMIHREGGRPYAPEFAHGLATQRLFASTIASVECEVQDGILHPPRGPGLGVTIDEQALNAHRL
jgi:o-succinylbenzoate synthase